MPENNEPKVLVGCVTYDKDGVYITDFLNAIRSQDFKNTDILFVDTSSSEEYSARLRGTGAIVMSGEKDLDHKIKRVSNGRNLIREYAISKGYDYLWFVDNDVMPKSDALSRLLSHRKDMIAGVCLLPANVDGSTKVVPNIYVIDQKDKGLTPVGLSEVMEDRVMDIASAGFGCVLVSRDVFEKIGIRYFENSMAGEDLAFFSDAREKGFSVFADSRVKCTHLVFPPGDPRNKRFMFDSYVKPD